MKTMARLWSDETGTVISAELVVVGAVVAAGATVGLSKMSSSLNDEFTEISRSMRSFDQSIVVRGRANGHAFSGSSSYIEPLADEEVFERPKPEKSPIPVARAGTHAVDTAEPVAAEEEEPALLPEIEPQDPDESEVGDAVPVPASEKL